MNEELLLSIKNAEHHNEKRRSLKNQLLRMQTTVNLTDGLRPYVISKIKNSINCNSSNIEAPTLSESICASYHNYDIDFDPVLTEDEDENNEIESFYDDQPELDDNVFLLNELFSLKDEDFSLKDKSDVLPLHPYTNISTNTFCINLIRTFREANLCKNYSSNMLKLIHLALPQPNNLPTSMNAVLKYIQGKLLFFIKWKAAIHKHEVHTK
jgi:hypothetical protein